MGVVNKQPSGNDYAVAKVLNDLIMSMIILVVIANNVSLPEDYEIKELNRAYILLANELQKLYDRNPPLASIEPMPIWKLFDILKTSTWEINEYLNDPGNDFGSAHTARVEKLCIIAGEQTPEYTQEQEGLVNHAKLIIADYGKRLDTANAENKAKKADRLHIPEYRLTYKPDGTILINDVLRLKKAHAGSTTERLLEQAMRSPNKLFKPEVGQTSRNLSTILSGAGFSKELRGIFFPVVSESKGVLFRNNIQRQQLLDEGLDVTEIERKLISLGATTEQL